jgi:hypothetical protein
MKRGLHNKNCPQNIVDEFIELYELAKYQEKVNLFKNLTSSENKTWQRYAWILERKFEEWNIKNESKQDTPKVEFKFGNIDVDNIKDK